MVEPVNQLGSRAFTLFIGAGLVLVCFTLASMPAWAQRPLGTDVSGYQMNIHWTAVKQAGVVFAWAKATEKTNYINPDFAAQEAGARSVGIYIGAYHFARPSSDPNITGPRSADTEATFFWSIASNYVRYGGHDLVPMLDWEDPLVSNQLSTAVMSAWVNEWCNDISNDAAAEGVFGVRPVVYTGTWYSNPANGYPGLNSTVTNWPDWIAYYPVTVPDPETGSPPSSYPWPSWDIWQYWDTNWSGGDADVFNGNLASFVQTFLVGGTNAPAPTNPTNLIVTPGSSVTFTVSTSGHPPLNFQWLFDGTVIPGATSSNFTLVDVQLADAGAYAVVVSNAYARVPSESAFLAVLVNAPGAVLAPPNLVNWWPADDTPLDIFGVNDGTPFNGLSYTNGEEGSAFHFDGSSSYLLVNGATNLPPPWTVCLWVNRQNAPGASAALMGGQIYVLKLEQYNGTRQVGITESGVADYLFSPNYTVPANTWTHLAFVGTATGVMLYADGVWEGSVAVKNFPLARACIGADLLPGRPTDFLRGSLDEIQVFNRALSGSEISAIYQAGNAGLVRAPQFTGAAPAGNGQIQLNLRGQTGKSFTLYSSTNLLDWTLLGTLPNPSGAVNHRVSTTSSRQKFYRVSQP